MEEEPHNFARHQIKAGTMISWVASTRIILKCWQKRTKTERQLLSLFGPLRPISSLRSLFDVYALFLSRREGRKGREAVFKIHHDIHRHDSQGPLFFPLPLSLLFPLPSQVGTNKPSSHLIPASPSTILLLLFLD